MRYDDWSLVQRFKALKEKGSRLFELWKLSVEWRHKYNIERMEAQQYRARLGETLKELELAKRHLAERNKDPLAEAKRLLRLAESVFDLPPPVPVYAIKAWLADYREWRLEDQRAEQNKTAYGSEIN